MPRGVTLLSGGVGGAKLAVGMAALLDPTRLTVIANTGDDIELFGLHISPDSDILTYTLAGRVDPDTGWGIAGDSIHTLSAVAALGGPDWFRLGDRDLATHLYRTEMLRRGAGLAEAAGKIARAMGVSATILPMCEKPVPTMVATDRGEMHLQEYLVRHGAEPTVRGLRFDGIDDAVPAPGVVAALEGSGLIVAAPSNPLISIGPILAVPGMLEAIRGADALRVGVSPIVGGRALKGPAAKMLRELGHEPSALGVARLWAHFLDVFVVDGQDAAHRPEIERLGLRCEVWPTVMRSREDKESLARRLLDLVPGAS